MKLKQLSAKPDGKRKEYKRRVKVKELKFQLN